MKTFCKNQENLCTFETKFLNRQKKEKKEIRREFCVKLKYLVEFSK